jgi:hypothetical protein
MKLYTMKIIVAVILLSLVCYACYRKGVKDGDAKASAYYQTEYGNDWNSDPSVHHSTSYMMGYARGKGMAEADTETQNKDFLDCGQKLADVAVQSGNPKIGGKLLVEHYISPEQLRQAYDKANNRPTP